MATSTQPTQPAHPAHPAHREADPQEFIADWLKTGLISAEQEEAMRHDVEDRLAYEESSLDVPSLLVEGIGYLGGAIVVAAALILLGTYWHEMVSPVRVGLTAVAAAGTLAAGWLIGSDHAAAARVRAVLLTAAVVTLAALIIIIGNEYGSGGDSLTLGVVVTSASAVYAGLLWWRNPTVLQQLATYVALLGAVALWTRELNGPPELTGVAPWAVALSWLLLAWGGELRPRAFSEAIGAAGAVFCSFTTMSTDAGNALAMTTAVALVVAAIVVRNLALLAIAAVGTLVSTTVAISDWFPGALTAPLSLLVVGGALVVVAVMVARRRRGPAAAAPALASGSRPVALGVAATLLAAATTTILIIALA